MGTDHPPKPTHAGVMGRARRLPLGNVHLGSAGFFVRGAAGFGRSKTLIQLDRASVYGTEGYWFEPSGVRLPGWRDPRGPHDASVIGQPSHLSVVNPSRIAILEA